MTAGLAAGGRVRFRVVSRKIKENKKGNKKEGNKKTIKKKQQIGV